MSISYKNVAIQILSRSGQLGDAADSAALDTLLAGTLANMIEGMELPLTILKRAMIASEKRVAQSIALSTLKTYRAALSSRTENIVSGDDVPTIDQNEIEIIGELGGIFDAATGNPLTEITKTEFARWQRHAGGAFRLPVYHFHAEDTTFFITTDAAYFKCCVFDQDAAEANFDADGDSVLPQGCETFWIAETLKTAAQEGWFLNEAGIYARVADQCEIEIKGGSVPSAKLPDAITFSDPVKN